MNDVNQAAATGSRTGDAPRVMSHEQMREHLDHQRASVLAAGTRYEMFVRHDGVWWISDHEGFIEMPDPTHNRRLDRWQLRLTPTTGTA
ncbi:MAG TPA: hypothetical protein VJT31_26295 [Rugosimonospora sp.]|nr:hypothetical protein [Rugosimonospora sp.]